MPGLGCGTACQQVPSSPGTGVSLALPPHHGHCFPGPRRVLSLLLSKHRLLECLRFMGEGPCHLSHVGKQMSLCPSPAWV